MYLYTFDRVPLYLDPIGKGEDAQYIKRLAAKVSNKHIVIKPFGSMARISLTNKEDYNIKIRSLSLRSTQATASHGYVDLSNPMASSAATMTGVSTVESVYLGPNFKGDFEDIKDAAFWVLHAADVIKRSYQATTVATRTSYDASAATWLSDGKYLIWNNMSTGLSSSNSTNENEFLIRKEACNHATGVITDVPLPLILLQSDDNKEFNG